MAEVDRDGLLALLLARDRGRRTIVAIAGAPGSGKSTVAESLVEQLNAAAPGLAALLPMDGYHYDDILLNQWGIRKRKGAPDTFDVGGFAQMLKRLRARDEAEVAVPVFDRAIEIARAGARIIPATAAIIIAEGNYLLLQRPPWPELAPLFDVTVMLDVPETVLRERLTARWQHYQLTPEDIAFKLDGNDLPNGRVVRTESAPAHYVMRNG
jgi:pantothenate kinase